MVVWVPENHFSGGSYYEKIAQSKNPGFRPIDNGKKAPQTKFCHPDMKTEIPTSDRFLCSRLYYIAVVPKKRSLVGISVFMSG